MLAKSTLKKEKAKQSPAQPASKQGWLVVIFGFIMHLSIGNVFLWGNIDPYFSEYFGTESTKLVYPISIILLGISSLFGVKLSKRFGPRRVLGIGSVIMIVGFLLLSFIKNFIGFFIIYLFMFSAPAGIMYLIPIACAITYFPNNRGMASGIIVAGFSLGPFIIGFIINPIMNPENRSKDFEGLDQSIPLFLWIMTGVFACCLGSSVYFIRYNKEQPILHPNAPQSNVPFMVQTNYATDSDGTGTEAVVKVPLLQKVEKKNECPSLKVGLLSRPFLHLAILSLFQAFYGQFLLSQFKNYYRSLGKPIENLDQSLSIICSCGLALNGVTRAGWAFLFDKFGFRVVYYTGLILQLILTLTITFVTDYLPLYGLYCCLSWSCMANLSGTFPAQTSKMFGLKHGSEIYGYIFLAFTLSNILSFAFVEAKVDDAIVFWISFGLTIFSGINSFFIKKSYDDHNWV